MMIVERELDRILTLLRNKIRDRGFTQLEVQEALGWGRSYISQLLRKQKSLRVDQVLQILKVISVEPAEFYAELYHYRPLGIAGYELPPEPPAVLLPAKVAAVVRGESDDGARFRIRDTTAALGVLLRLMVEKHLISSEELSAVIESEMKGP